MRNPSVICSLLLAFTMSALIVGCEPPTKPATKEAPKTGAGSTTGGGTVVPKASTGTSEAPKAPEKAVEGEKTAEPDAAKDSEAPKN